MVLKTVLLKTISRNLLLKIILLKNVFEELIYDYFSGNAMIYFLVDLFFAYNWFYVCIVWILYVCKMELPFCNFFATQF